MKTLNTSTLSAVLFSGLLISGAASAESDRGTMWYGDTSSIQGASVASMNMSKDGSYSGNMWYGDPVVKKNVQDTKNAQDIVDIAVGAGNFSTLVIAVQEAGLVETLKGEGPFTVFAPTDEAFAKIPADQLQALLADKEALTEILTYHVVPGKVLAQDVVALNSATTVQGSNIDIDTSNGVRVDSAKVVATDIVASNGVIHVIDTVIMPQSSAQL